MQGKFTWKIENFTKLKDLLKKRKITSLCIKSRRFQVGGKDCRLIVYPRGQSQPPMHLSMFLEVTDSRNQEADWSCFVSHRLSVINQHKDSDKSVSKESQNRYSKAAKDWGWREFVTLTSLFDTDLGFLVNDTVVLCAEVWPPVLPWVRRFDCLPICTSQIVAWSACAITRASAYPETSQMAALFHVIHLQCGAMQIKCGVSVLVEGCAGRRS